MLRLLAVFALCALQACSYVSRLSVYPLPVGDTAPVELNLSTQQISNKLESAYARWQGTPYRYGHQVPGLAADCSGFIQQVFKNQLSMNLPRTTRQQISWGKEVALNNAKPGDLVFFNLNNGYGHVAVYLENNVVMQATTTAGVTKTNLNTSEWWSKRVFMVKRIIK